jgi:superfamily II DNA or RNA helicase
MMQSALEKGKRVVFIVDRIILTNQTSNVLNDYGISHGVIQGHNDRFNIYKDLQVCSIQTLARRGCPFSDLIIIDEVHVFTEAHKKIMQENPNAFVLGLTATPYTKGLGKYFDFHIYPVTIRQCIDAGYLIPYDIYGPHVADLTKLKVRAGEYTEESLSDVFDKVDIIGDVVNTWKKLCAGKKTIVFGANIAHIKNLVRQFEAAGVKACQINAYQDEKERGWNLNGFMYGDTQVLCSVEVAVKGFDYPGAEVCILAVATKSIIKWTQTTGRVLRTCKGKERAMILDFGGNAERLGFPEDYEFTELDQGKKKKQEAIKKEKIPKICPSCDFIKPIGVNTCPRCGFLPERKSEIEAGEGELEKLKRKDRKDFSVAEKQLWLAQFNQYAAEHGHKKHWKGFYGSAIHAYNAKFGCAPSNSMSWNEFAPVSEDVQKFMTHLHIKYAKGSKYAKINSR